MLIEERLSKSLTDKSKVLIELSIFNSISLEVIYYFLFEAEFPFKYNPRYYSITFFSKIL